MSRRLSLDYHVQHKSSETLGLLKRTRSLTASLVRFSSMLAVDHILQLVLLCGASIWMFDWRYVAMMLVCMVAYSTTINKI